MLAKELIPIILKDRVGGQYYVEPFVGGANLIQFVDGNCIGGDSNKYVIAHLNKIKEDTSWVYESAKDFKRENYYEIRDNLDNYEPYLIGHVAYNLSFGGKWFGGWQSNKRGDDLVAAGYIHVLRQSEKIKHIHFTCCEYSELPLPCNSIIYCDPPYKGTEKYKNIQFDYDLFYQWCIQKRSEGHQIFISEYEMPSYFKCIWEKQVRMGMDCKTNGLRRVERLFTLK